MGRSSHTGTVTSRSSGPGRRPTPPGHEVACTPPAQPSACVRRPTRWRECGSRTEHSRPTRPHETDWPATPASWDTYDARKRRLVDGALAGLAKDHSERIRDAVLEADALGLGRRFHTFTLDPVEPSFYRGEAADALRPISASALPHDLTFGYQVRIPPGARPGTACARDVGDLRPQ